MTKEEVELIIIKVTADAQDAIHMKIYKNGTTCRSGVGSLPEIGISGMSFFTESPCFDSILSKVPQEVLNQPIHYEEETPNGYFEYVIAFYGVSKNGETGERADWSKSTGMRVKLDHQTGFNHPIMGLLDGLTIEATELTNEWYFDIIVNAKFKALSSSLPKETIISLPKTEMEIHQAYENYINQMIHSARKWSMTGYDKNKTYELNGQTCMGIIIQKDNTFDMKFFEA